MSTYREALKQLNEKEFTSYITFKNAFRRLSDDDRQEFVNDLITEQKILRAREAEART
jgi:hypothetical protein